MRRSLIAILPVFAALACSPPEASDCERYAAMEASCSLPAPADPSLERQAAHIACTEAESRSWDWLARLQARRSECALSANACDDYRECKWQIRLP